MRPGRTVWIAGAVAIAVGAAALLYFIALPAGAGTPEAALVEHVGAGADAASVHVLARKDWGSGELALVGYNRRGVRHLALAFVDKEIRGWHVASYSEQTVEPADVVVGSLIVGSSSGGKGQPAWSAAAGELLDTRVDHVEARWSSGTSTLAPKVGTSYLVVQRGTPTPIEMRFLSKDGTNIATVPVGTS